MLLVTIAASMTLPLAVSAQAGALPQNVMAVNNAPHALLIASGDLLELGVFDSPELSARLRVSEGGQITVPVAGVVQVSGMTAEEAALAVEAKLRSKDIVKDPHVSVFITEYATQGVTVAGEVNRPGIYPLLGSHSLLDLVSAAGGVSPKAGNAVTVTHKSDPEHPEVLQFDNRAGSIATKLDIHPGDSISVSRAGIVYVVGEVNKPGGFLIESNNLTALDALALAQGPTHSAAQDKARLIRKTPTSREELSVPLKRILLGKSVDLPLQDGDILFVPTASAKNAGLRVMETAIGITTGLVIYGGKL
jgi:polysaccharide export outer membrane protein